MKLMILATGETQDFEESYGARLVEQGRAVPAPKVKKPAAEAAREKPAKKG